MVTATSKIKSGAVAILVLLAVLAISSQRMDYAQAAHSGTADVLILDSTVSGGAASNEATKATGLGLSVDIVSPAEWGTLTTADFESYKAIILGDPTCVTGTGPIAAAEASIAEWGPAITGNVVVVGTDPTFHSTFGPGGAQGGDQVTESGIAFAADEPGETGAYITLSCYYAFAAPATSVPLLDAFSPGGFSVVGQGGCPAASHILVTHPALAGLTNADLSNWGCSTHEAFQSWPADFQVLAINSDVPSDVEVCGVDLEGDSVCGSPYILARGEDLRPIGGALDVSKRWSHTNVCFERDNDGDGFVSEDHVDFDDAGEAIDNDGDLLFNEDPSECPDGTSLGTDLDTDDNGDYQIQAVVHKSGKVNSYNPGQVYAVSTVDVSSDIDGLIITEDYVDCTTGDPALLDLNPAVGQGGGSVVVVILNSDGVPVQILDAMSPEVVVTDNEATVTLGPQADGTTIMVYVKFAPGQKGHTFSEDSCENVNSAQALDDLGEPDGDPVDAAAILELTAKR